MSQWFTLTVVSWWGWIANREELKARYGAESASGDAALLKAAWQTDGPSGVAGLVGEFAAHLRDGDTDILIRDAMGVVPLFFTCENDGGVTANPDIEALIRQVQPVGVDRNVMIHNYAGSAYTSTKTVFKGVHRVPAGHYTSVKDGRPTTYRHFHPDKVPPWDGASFTEAVNQLDLLVHSAVRDATRTASRVGLHLSGGLDSGVVAAIARDQEQKTSHWRTQIATSWTPKRGLDAAETPEHRAVRLTSEHLGLTPRPPDDQKILAWQRHADPLVYHPKTTAVYEGGFAQDYADLDVDTVLSGWGGDEIISTRGVSPLPEFLRRHDFTRAARELTRAPAFGTLKSLAPSKARRVRSRRKLAQDPITAAWIEAYPHLLDQHSRAQTPPRTTREKQLGKIANGHMGMRTEAWWKIAHAHRYEYRYPLLDLRVVTFALSLPGEYYCFQGKQRRIFRALAQRYLPEPIASTTKIPEPERVAHLPEIIVTQTDLIAETYPELLPEARFYDDHQSRLLAWMASRSSSPKDNA